MKRNRSSRWPAATVAIDAAGRAVAVAAARTTARPKYGNRKVTVDGVTWDSEGERARYGVLCQQQAAGLIADLKRSVDFELAPACSLGGPRKKPALRYRADFTYTENGELIVEDFKSPATRANPVYRIKKHLMMTVHSILIRETSRK